MFRRALFTNFLGVLLFSPLRLILNIYFTSKLMPSDYGIYVLFLILYSITEVFVDFGSRGYIIQAEIKELSKLKAILKDSFLTSIFVSTIFVIIALISSEYSYLWLSSIIILRSLSLVPESILQLSQRFLEVQTLEFIATIFGISTSLLLLEKGFKNILLINLFTYVAFYTFLLLARTKEMTIDFSGIPNFDSLNKKRFGLFKNQILDLISLRSDEYVLSQLVGTSVLGTFTKSREIGNMIGGITSKVFSRPLFVQIAKTKNNPSYQDMISKVICWYSSFTYAGVIIGYLSGVELPFSMVYGKNWVVLDSLSWLIISVSLMYFLTTLRRYFMLGIIRQDDLTRIDIICLILRLVFLVALFFMNEFSISTLLILELVIRFISSELMAMNISGLLSYGKSRSTWFNFALVIILVLYHA